MAGLVSLASRIAQAMQPSLQKSAVYLIQLDPMTDAPLYAATLQYFPESLSDTKAVNWQAKEIPGGSLPMYQWTGSGERTISFTAQFSTDVDYLVQTANSSLLNMRERLKNTGQLKYNVDIRSAVAWLRSCMLPTYDQTRGRTLPPYKVVVYIPYSGIGVAGGSANLLSNNTDSIVAVMTSCEVSWEKFFPSGAPRLASVSLSFAQVPQYAGKISFPGVTSEMTDAYKLDAGTLIASGVTSNQSGANKFLGYTTAYDGSALDPLKK